MLDRLERADRLAELFAGLGIVHGHGQRRLGNASQIGRNQQRGAIGGGAAHGQHGRQRDPGERHCFIHASHPFRRAQRAAGQQHRALRADQQNLLRRAAIDQVCGAIAEGVGEGGPGGPGNQRGAQGAIAGKMRRGQLGENRRRGEGEAKRPRDQRFLGKSQTHAAALFGGSQPEQAKFDQFVPHGLLGGTAVISGIAQALDWQVVQQKAANPILDHALVFARGQIDDHRAASRALGPLGRPSRRSAMALRRISMVPPPMPHLKLSR